MPIAEAKQDVYTRLGARPDAVVRVGHGPALDPPDRGPVRRGARVRVERLRRRPRWPTRSRSAETDGAGRAGQRAGARRRRPGRRHLRPRRHARLRPPGRRRRPRRLLQLLAAAPGLARGRHPSSSPSGSTSGGRCGRGVRITATYDWPDHVDGSSQARVGEHQVDVDTERRGAGRRGHGRGSRRRFVNPSRRPPAARPPAAPASRPDQSQAESAFAVVTRGLTAEGRPDEFGLPTAPANRFVSAGRLTVVHEGVCEYELIDIEGGRRRRHHRPHRPALDRHAVPPRHGLPALPGRPAHAGRGPADAGQARSSCATRWPLDCDDPYALADDVLLPLEPVQSLGRWHRARPRAAHWRSHGAEVERAPPRRRRARGPGLQPDPDDDRRWSFPGRAGWLVDLRGYPQEPFEGSFELRPFGIATARLAAD